MKALSSVALRPLYSLGRFASSVSLHSHSSSPLFELLKAKGVLVARLNPGTYILCNSNNVIAKSTKIQSAMILSGFSILQKVGANKNNSGEVILSPKKKDDELLMFVMDGSVDYWVQKNSLLAAGSELNLFHSIFSKHYRVSGKGPLAFYGNGSIVKVTLAPNEESIVRKR
ncbi:hypothetical protein HK098_004759 [Nowakowskiella sp. JEL0407]|nr:hypothetical protein HK098_004759 [Nowakowskiella sp. JEL0407]